MPTPNFVFSKVSVVKNRAYFEYQYLDNQNPLYTFTETIEFPETYDLEQIEKTKLNAYLTVTAEAARAAADAAGHAIAAGDTRSLLGVNNGAR